jgi:hypothetical protein
VNLKPKAHLLRKSDGRTSSDGKESQPATDDMDNEIWRAVNPGLSAFRGLLYVIGLSVLAWLGIIAALWAGIHYWR